MRPIQPLLIFLLIGLAILYLSRMRSRFWDRMVPLIIVVIGILMVTWPDMSTRAANLLGVGRGVDLILYLALIGLLFLMMTMFSELRKVQWRVTELSRALAILQANTATTEPHQSEDGPLPVDDRPS